MPLTAVGQQSTFLASEVNFGIKLIGNFFYVSSGTMEVFPSLTVKSRMRLRICHSKCLSSDFSYDLPLAAMSAKLVSSMETATCRLAFPQKRY